MLPYDIVYYRPETPQEAAEAWKRAEEEGLGPLYLSGGTEITTFARKGLVKTGAVIDLKGIAADRRIEEKNGSLRIGAGTTLSEVKDSGFFPLFGRACGGVADRTVRNRITVGGNIAGRLPYREAVLPLLIVDAEVQLHGPEGERSLPLAELFDKRLKLEKGEYIRSFTLDAGRAETPWHYGRRTRGGSVDYPLVTACFLAAEDGLRIAAGGLFPFAVRLTEAEKALSDGASPAEAAEAVSATYRTDERGSGEYRRRLLELEIEAAQKKLGGAR
jgi:CO/xanthine dehydrogenase FAD-binding subunit